MRAHDFEDLLDERRRKSRADLALRGKELREAGLLPAGGRGPNVPQILPLHATRYLVAAAADVNAKDCATAVAQFMGLRLARTKGRSHFAKGAGTFGEALEAALSDVGLAQTVKGIHLTAPVPDTKYLRDPVAMIVWADVRGNEHRSNYVPQGLEDIVSLDDYHSQSLIRDTAIIGGELIVTLAKSLGFSANAPAE